MKFFILFGVFFACYAFMMLQCSAKAFIGSLFNGFFGGESMYRYRFDLETGTSYYRRSDGTIDKWQSPQSREFYPNTYYVKENRKKKKAVIPRQHLDFYTNLFLK
ncbi:hypothetical protein PVAND_013705 [Polypedilum vanderplanki]|uniref:Uncharacterized protein n=1 Tax=Polypedilum vanderplanki TaxID=319348 RepID=A0A9J6CRI7_POLVA|nr:hypothetical protein PVAND_013705 [Polypedilum vanderplanki]